MTYLRRQILRGGHIEQRYHKGPGTISVIHREGETIEGTTYRYTVATGNTQSPEKGDACRETGKG